ncbi:high mobility group B protein 1-like [Magnolia sinica]|uniref:high mobility group B protein 1-like n=1 Tax=Magnolia sinica TaxID=86752 RepID=UPI002657CD59|nr:high mobility group B protein 1-like [Magnolia sinica]XP_058083601.1 high mobility group B protein 1-like [Magnolia sinica]
MIPEKKKARKSPNTSFKAAKGKGATKKETKEALKPVEDREEFRKICKQEHPNVKSVSAVGKAGIEKWKSLSDAVSYRSCHIHVYLWFQCYCKHSRVE